MKHKTAKANVKTKTRLLSLLLAVLMMLFCFPVTALGTDEAEEPISETLEETADAGLSAFERGVGELSPEALESMTLNAADVPEVISTQAIAEKDHVLRLREQEENLNTVVFQNRDGGKTVYLYANPVKYVDSNGNVKDKSTALKAENITLNGKTYSHSATENVFGQYYPTMPQNGVLITFGQYTVEMAPVITGILTLRDTAVANNKVTYNKVFGNGTSLVYTPTLSGVKEDIILQTYMGKSSFSFTLKTNGLAIVQTESDTFLADFEGNKVASLGKVIITDKVGKTVYGTMTVIAVAEREEYTVTINAPVEFLTSSATVYPVTVDPTVNITENVIVGENSDGYIYGYGVFDQCIYDGGNPNAPISSIGKLFYNEDSCKFNTARMLYRINPKYLQTSSVLTFLTAPRLESASLWITVQNNHYSSSKVNIHPYSAYWGGGENENGEMYYYNDMIVNYSSNPEYDNYISNIFTSTIISNDIAIPVEFDITSIVEYWNKHGYEDGLIMKLEDESEGEHLEPETINIWQSEYSGTSVYISIDYSNYNGEYFINSKYNGKFLESKDVGNTPMLSTYSTHSTKNWIFEYVSGDNYYIRSNANSRYCLYDSGTNINLVDNLQPSSLSYEWTIVFNYEHGGYTIKNASSGRYIRAIFTDLSPTNIVDKYCIWRIAKKDNYIPVTDFTIVAPTILNAFEEVSIDMTTAPLNATWNDLSDFDVVPYDGRDATYQSNGTIVAVSKGEAKFTVTHKPTGKTKTILINVLETIANGKYYIKNKSTNLNLYRSGSDSYIRQTTVNTDTAQKWQITHLGNGYYGVENFVVTFDASGNRLTTIYRLGVSDGNTTSSANIISKITPNDSEFNDSEKWKIRFTDSGGGKINCCYI